MKSQVIRLTTVVGAAVLAATAAHAQYAEGFETYTLGSDITGQGGFSQWDNNPIVDNAVSNAFAHGGSTQSLYTELHADKVHQVNEVAGHWNWGVYTYVPVTQTLPQWAVHLISYAPGGPYFWVFQCNLDPTLGQIAIDMGPNAVCGGIAANQFGVTAPLVVGNWADLHADVDLGSDRAQLYYNGSPIGQVWQWSNGISAGFGPVQFGFTDWYANDNTVAGDRMYWDDMYVTANANPAPQCHGVSSTYCTSGTSLSGCTPTIGSSGVPSASATSGFTITLTASEGNRQGLLFYGRTGQIAVPWANTSTSVLCVKAPTQRTPLQPISGTATNCDANYSLDWNAYMNANPTSLGNPRFFGESFDAQWWYRDNSGAVKTTSLSNALHFALDP